MIVKAVWRSPAGTVGWVILLGFVLLGAVGPAVTPFSPYTQHLSERLAPPGARASDGKVHLLGTDRLGRDILSRLLAGARITLAVALMTSLVGGSLGCLLGLIAGYYRGWPDRLIMRLTDIQLAFPFVLLALIVIAVLGPSLTNLILVLAFTNWVDYARVIRGEVLSVRAREFIEAARATGARDPRVIGRHVLPNVMTTTIVIATLQLAKVVILETSLSFLGLGVQPPTPDWGLMLAEGRDFVATAWWLAAFPGLAILLLVLSVNLVGDWLSTYLNPRRSLWMTTRGVVA